MVISEPIATSVGSFHENQFTADNVNELTCKGIGHAASTQSMLEFGAHETVSFTGASENQEMDLEHSHVE